MTDGSQFPANVRDLLEARIVAVLATRRRDDTVLLSPVWFEWRDGAFHVWVDRESAGKVRHVQRDPRVSLVISTPDPPYRGIELRGEATMTDEDYFGVMRRTAERYYDAEHAAKLVADYPYSGYVMRIVPVDVRTWDYTPA